MTNRREFLQIGIAATAWPIASRAAMGATPGGAGKPGIAATVPLYKAIYDTRFPESVAFGRQMKARGVPVHSIEGDITPFWYNELDLRWRKAPVAIAGLTAHGPLFCFEQLGRDYGMRVVFRADHSVQAGCLQHRLNGPAALLRASEGLGTTRDWATAMADLATRCPTGRAELAGATIKGPAADSALAGGDPLISWVIAPAAKA